MSAASLPLLLYVSSRQIVSNLSLADVATATSFDDLKGKTWWPCAVKSDRKSVLGEIKTKPDKASVIFWISGRGEHPGDNRRK